MTDGRAGQPVERLRLGQRAREAVEDPAGRGVGPRDPFLDHRDDQLVGDELARVHELLRLAAELGALGNVLAEHVARRDVRDPQLARERLRLRPLAGARRSQEDHPVTAVAGGGGLSPFAHGSGLSS